jgi:mannose-6-phosphate isomerase-like protein (cupin superfamily)
MAIEQGTAKRYYGPARWAEQGPAHVYPSGTVLRPFNVGLGLTTGLLRMSVARVLPGQDVEHHRHHTMSEIYYLMRGRGQFRVDDQVFDVEENSAMFFPPGPMRSVYNNSSEENWWLFVGSPPDVKPGAAPPPELAGLTIPEVDATGQRRFYGPVRWEDQGPPHVYPSGTVLRPFNVGLGLTTGLLRMSVARMQPGQDVEHHRHYTMSEIYYLMKGRAQFRIDDQVIDVEENTACFFPPEPMRSVHNNSNEECWWLFVGSPPDVKPEHG